MFECVENGEATAVNTAGGLLADGRNLDCDVIQATVGEEVRQITKSGTKTGKLCSIGAGE